MSGEGAEPRATFDLVGHAEAEATFRDALASNRMPHAWIIGGPAGVGKATLAFRIARYILANGAVAPAEPSLFVLPDHPVARRVAAGSHLDLLTVERAVREKEGTRPRDLPVDEIRKIQPFLTKTSAEGGWKVVVVDDAETMNRSSANAILKVLEEPPGRSIILMVTSNVGGLLPTIRSRCRKLILEPLPLADVDAFLAGRRTGLDPTDRCAVARLAEGCPGRALSLADADALGVYRRMLTMLRDMPRLDIPELMRVGEGMSKGEEGTAAYRVSADLLVWWLARLARSIAAGRLPEEVLPGEDEVMRRFADMPAALERWLEVWEKTRRLFAQVDGATLDRRYALLQAFRVIESALVA